MIHAVAGERPDVNDGFDQLNAQIETNRNNNTMGRWLADGNHALQLRHFAVGDFGYTSTGNWKRGNLLIDWVQFRYDELDQGLARPLQVPTVVGAPLANRGIDTAQRSVEEIRLFLGRSMLWLISGKILNGIEDGIGAVRHWRKATPAEEIVDR